MAISSRGKPRVTSNPPASYTVRRLKSISEPDSLQEGGSNPRYLSRRSGFWTRICSPTLAVGVRLLGFLSWANARPLRRPPWKTPVREGFVLQRLRSALSQTRRRRKTDSKLAVPPRRERLWGATPGKRCRLGPEPVSGSAFRAAVSDWKRLSQERDRWFESGSLQQRVCELSVPERRTDRWSGYPTGPDLSAGRGPHALKPL
jgi:hypothetical protein